MPKSNIPVETLIQQLHGTDWMARCDAARLLGQSGDPRAVDALLPDLNDPDWRVRRNAAQALGALRDKRAVEPLLQALKDRTMTVRQRAMVALGRIKDPQAIPALIEILLAEKHESYDAAQAIRKFGKKALPELAKAFEGNQNRQLMMLLIGLKYAGSLDLLLKMLESQDTNTRFTAVQELGKLGDKKAIPYLMEQLSQNDLFILGEAVRALGKLNAIEAVPTLLGLLTDDELYGPRSSVYHAVTEAFQMWGNILDEIKNAFPGKYPALFNMGGAEISLPEAMGLLGNDHMNRLNDALSMLQRGFPVSDKLPGPIANTVRNTLDDMAWKFGVMFQDARDASQDRVRRLMELLKAESSLMRAAAALTLPWYSDEKSLDALAQATQDPDETVKKAATWAFDALQKTLMYRRQRGL